MNFESNKIAIFAAEFNFVKQHNWSNAIKVLTNYNYKYPQIKVIHQFYFLEIRVGRISICKGKLIINLLLEKFYIPRLLILGFM